MYLYVLFFLFLCNSSSLKTTLYVSAEDYATCNTNLTCESVEDYCSLFCPFEEGNKRIEEETVIKLGNGRYALFGLTLNPPHYAVTEISKNNVNITIQPLADPFNVDDIYIDGFPYKHLESDPIFYISGKNIGLKMKGFSVEQQVNFQTTLVLLDPNSEVSSFVLDSMQIRGCVKVITNDPVMDPNWPLTENDPSKIREIRFLHTSFFYGLAPIYIKLKTPHEEDTFHFYVEDCKFEYMRTMIAAFVTHNKMYGYVEFKKSQWLGTGDHGVCAFLFDDRFETSGGIHVRYENCLCHNNNEAAIAISSNIQTLEIISSIFDNNGQVGDGGAYLFNLYGVYLESKKGLDISNLRITVWNSTFSNNKHKSIFKINLLKEYSTFLNISMKDSKFINNTPGITKWSSMAGLDVKALFLFFQISSYIQSTASIVFDNCLFEGNSGYEHIAYFSPTGEFSAFSNGLPSISIKNSRFFGNSAIVSILNFLPTGYTWSVINGEVWNDCDNNFILVQDTLFSYNTAGSIILDDRKTVPLCQLECPRLIIDRCQFFDNNATIGGIIHATRSGLIFFDQSALEDPGIKNVMHVISSKFARNNAINGGMLFAENVKIGVKDIIVEDSTAQYGGAIFFKKSLISNISDLDINFTISHNHAKKSGGAVFQEGSETSFLDYKKDPDISLILLSNTAGKLGVSNDISRTPVKMIQDRSVENTCSDWGGKKVWSCILKEIQLYDVHDNVVDHPTYKSIPISIRIIYERKTYLSTEILSSDRDSDGFNFQFRTDPELEGIHNGYKLPVEISFLDDSFTSSLVLTYPVFKYGYLIGVIGGTVLIIIFLVLMMLCLYCCCIMSIFCLCCCSTSCGFYFINLMNRWREKLTFKDCFGKYDDEELFKLYQNKNLRDEEKEYEESTELLNMKDKNNNNFISVFNKGEVFDEHHIFKGDLNGEGEIFYFYKKPKKKDKLKRVFHGEFKFGKKNGFGTEFYHESLKLEKVKFQGMYSKNIRNGKGTEFSEDGKFIVGEWKNGSLCRVIWNNHALNIINFTQLKLEKLIYPVGIEDDIDIIQLATTRLYEGTYKKKECVVKIFEDLRKTRNPVIATLIERERTESIKRNLKILTLFQHPNILSFFGWSGPTSKNKNKEFFYVMEKAVCSIYDLLLKGNKNNSFGFTINMALKKRILGQTALGMEHISKNCGLIHRDLKTTNILIDNLGNVKICDFDFAITNDEEYFGRKIEEEIAGSPFHIPPEVLIDNQFGSKTDVYSFAILMYEILFLDCLDDPYMFRDEKKRKCNVCNQKYKGNYLQQDNESLINFMKKHYKMCNLRPFIPTKKKEEEVEGEEEEEEEEEIEDWLIDVMKKCWDKNVSNRPDFGEILEMFSRE